ncbi:MAG TPA: HAD family hydrolase [Pseudobdellovibrionaceae bacterium]|nr:HAD family hydrolase [Pseudobdellovibrionaceae bacterium]
MESRKDFVKFNGLSYIPPDMTHSRQILRQTLLKIRDLRRQGHSTLVVYDLDSTLYNVSPRLERILLDFALEKDHQQLFPEQIALFKNIQTLRQDWGILNALRRAGLDEDHPEFQKAVHHYWHQQFFSNHYLKYDQPYEGAIEFVKLTHRTGAEIVYLTGRDQSRMSQGTQESLKNWNFPLSESEKAYLVLKPEKGMDDAEFKRDWFKQYLKTRQIHQQHVWFFENEPQNIDLVQRDFPEMNIIFLDTTHAGVLNAPENLPRIMDYLCDLHEED